LASHLLQSIPPVAVCLIVGLVIMAESLGTPVPGEITLLSAAVLAAQHKLAVPPVWIAVSGSAGAIVGDSIGFAIGRRFGPALFGWLGRKFPAHFGPPRLAAAERIFASHGVWPVFFGRFVAVLRILAGPLAGSLRMPYGRFLAANACGGIAWAAGMTYLVWFLGVAAGHWLSRLSWLGLAVGLAAGLAVSLLIRRQVARLDRPPQPPAPAGDGPAPRHQASSTGPGRPDGEPIARLPPSPEGEADGRRVIDELPGR
jgi:membrane protein DedA with SNARE-associated domain